MISVRLYLSEAKWNQYTNISRPRGPILLVCRIITKLCAENNGIWRFTHQRGSGFIRVWLKLGLWDLMRTSRGLEEARARQYDLYLSLMSESFEKLLHFYYRQYEGKKEIYDTFITVADSSPGESFGCNTIKKRGILQLSKLQHASYQLFEDSGYLSK